MINKLLNIFLLLGLTITLVANWIIGSDRKQRNKMFLPEMVSSIPSDAYSVNPNFPDGKTLQLPVVGTIPRGHMPLHYEATAEDAIRAGVELSNPLPPDSSEAELEGAYLYTDFCFPCHGATGMGDGPIALRGFPPPPALSSEKSMNLSDGQMFHILTYGQGSMPLYKVQMSRVDRWKVILHVRELQRKLNDISTPENEGTANVDAKQEVKS